MRTWPPALLLLFGLLVLLGTGVPGLEVDSPARLYDRIDGLELWNDEPTGLLPAGVRYAIYWLATAAGIVLLATLVSWLVRIVLWRIPSAMWAVARRYDRGERLAVELADDGHHLARTRLAGRDPPSEALPRRERRRVARAIRLQRETPGRTIQWWVWRQRACDRIDGAFRRFAGWFGGLFTTVPTWTTAFPLPLVIVTTTIVLLTRPVRDQSARAEQALDDAWSALTMPDTGRLLPVALIVLGLLVVARRGPLIDDIRARDDAARDANRLLGELQGQLLRVLYAMYDWRRQLDDARWGMVSRWVDEASSGTYQWRLSGGIEPASRRRLMSLGPRVEEAWETDRYAELDRLCEELATLMAKITDAGLHSVAIRLARRVYRPLHHLGLTTTFPTAQSIRRQIATPSSLGKDWKHHFLFERPTSADPNGMRYFEAELEDEAFKRARWADLTLAQLRLAERSIEDVLDFLGRRVAGRFWTRLLSGVKN
jgi:hypothetical protein